MGFPSLGLLLYLCVHSYNMHIQLCVHLYLPLYSFVLSAFGRKSRKPLRSAEDRQLKGE